MHTTQDKTQPVLLIVGVEMLVPEVTVTCKSFIYVYYKTNGLFHLQSIADPCKLL